MPLHIQPRQEGEGLLEWEAFDPTFVATPVNTGKGGRDFCQVTNFDCFGPKLVHLASVTASAAIVMPKGGAKCTPSLPGLTPPLMG